MKKILIFIIVSILTIILNNSYANSECDYKVVNTYNEIDKKDSFKLSTNWKELFFINSTYNTCINIINFDNINILDLKLLWQKYIKYNNDIFFLDYNELFKINNLDINSFKIVNDFMWNSEDKNFIFHKNNISKVKTFFSKDNVTLDDFKIDYEDLSITALDSYYIYSTQLYTNIEWNFLAKFNYDWVDYEYKFIDGVLQYGSIDFRFDRSDIVNNIYITIYDTDKKVVIWTYWTSVKFSNTMDKPIYIDWNKLSKVDHTNSKTQIKKEESTLKNTKTTNNKLKIKSKVLFFKKLILTKKTLEESSKWELYKWAVDKRVSSLDDKRLVIFHNLLWKIDLENIKYRKYKLVLEYMKAKIWIEIWKRDGIEKEIL